MRVIKRRVDKLKLLRGSIHLGYKGFGVQGLFSRPFPDFRLGEPFNGVPC